MTIKLTAMPYAQATVTIFDNPDLHAKLTSYATDVAYLHNNGDVIVTGLYSQTTRKHISAFAREYCRCDYYTLKKCYTDNLIYNIYTKEYRKA